MTTAFVRPATAHDAAALLPLMRGLATFEGYIDDFAVTEDDIVRQGFVEQPPHFHAFVAESDAGEVVAMLVYYFVPFTYRGRPTLYIKELFVKDSARGHGIGEALMREAARAAVAAGCALMKWHVVRWNEDGARFYRRLGARVDDTLVDYSLGESGVRVLAAV